MSIAGGAATITINSDGTFTVGGSGMATVFAEFGADLLLSSVKETLVDVPDSVRSTLLQSIRTTAVPPIVAAANAAGASLVAYLQANLKAHVTTQQLGNLPAVLTPGTPIDPPTSPVDIPCQ